ncbi:MAG: tetratricopeptide repeat protein [Dehalococcoidia bacterium]
MAILAALGHPSPLATLALGLAKLTDGQTAAAVESLAKVRRCRQPLPEEASQATSIAAVVAQTRTGDLTSAWNLLQSVAVPGNPALRHALATAGRALARESVIDERADEALLAWQQSLVAEPSHEPIRRAVIHLHEVLGTRAVRCGDFAEAARHWEAALAEQPDDTRSLQNLALAEERRQRWQQAAAHWEELTQRWKKALRAARRDDAAGNEPRQRLTVAYRHLAATYEAAKDLPAATRTFERALNFDPSDIDLRLRAAELYLENEQYRSAIDQLQRVLAGRPDDTRVLIDLGSAFDLKGDDRQAQNYLERALSLEPEDQAVKASLAGVHHARGHRLLATRQGEGAVAEMTRSLELDPSATEHEECLGEAYLKIRQIDVARAIFKRSLARDPKDPNTRLVIGGLYLQAGYEREADVLFRQALRLKGGPMTQLGIGLVYLRSGNMAKASERIRSSCRRASL